MTTTIAYLDDSTGAGWNRTVYAFLVETERRSGSRRTVESYGRMLNDFFGRSGKAPDQISTQDVFAWANERGLSGKEASAITIGSRIACVSSFYRFLIRMQIVAVNPSDRIERPRTPESRPRGLSANGIQQLLSVLPRSPVGLRDRAIILTLTFTGRRRAEVLGLTAGNIECEGVHIFYGYRGKGGKTGKRELPQPAYEAIRAWLACAGKDLASMQAADSLWPDLRTGRGITSGTFYGNLRRYLTAAGLPAGGVHIFRHTAAKLRRDAGESVEDVSRFLDHSSLAVTTTYLRRPEGQEVVEGRRGDWPPSVLGLEQREPVKNLGY